MGVQGFSSRNGHVAMLCGLAQQSLGCYFASGLSLEGGTYGYLRAKEAPGTCWKVTVVLPDLSSYVENWNFAT